MSRTRLILLLTLAATSLALATTAGEARAASVLRVPQDYSSIQAAIDAASPGDVVRVSAGVYNELIDNHSKAITIESTDGAAVTVIDGLGGALRLTATPGEIPVLRGFTVEGGIFTSDGPALIESNRVLDDESCSGGIFAYFSSATIRSNLVTGRPGCSLYRPAIDIGGAGAVTVTRNVITANPGGGVSMNAGGSPTISDNTITANGGSGIAGVNQSDALIVNNVVAENGYHGIDWGVPFGTRGPIIVNNTIAANSLSAIFVDGFTGSMRVFNNILVGTGIQTVVNCPGSFFEKDPPILEFNDVVSAGTGSLYGGVCSDLTGVNGNISANPAFSGVSDFRLQLGSPAIDAGTSVGAPSIDIEGNARPRDGNADGVALWDMGAYEFLSNDSMPPIITVPADITIDATGPGGTPVSYHASAVDDVDGTVAVTCAPASGSAFPIGTGTVNCTARDAAGNTANASFAVYVKGASEQIADLIVLVDSYKLGLLGTALHEKLVKAQGFLDVSKPKRACEVLDRFLAQVKEQRGKRISVERADRLTSDVRRIKAVIGC